MSQSLPLCFVPRCILREYPTRCTRFNPACELDVKKQLWKIQENIILIKDLRWRGTCLSSSRVQLLSKISDTIRKDKSHLKFYILYTGLKFVLLSFYDISIYIFCIYILCVFIKYKKIMCMIVIVWIFFLYQLI